MSLLSVQGLCKSFGAVVAVDDVSLAVEPGEVVALIGPNGAGKSTTFNLLGGVLAPDRGAIAVDGVPIAGLPATAVWRHGVGRTFQIAAAFRSLTVRQNVTTALLARNRRQWRFWERAEMRFRDEADALLADVGLQDGADRTAATIAYADLKRLEVAIALAGAPRLLLMDEPTAGLAATERRDLMDLVVGLAKSPAASGANLAILFTEHDMSIVFGHADRIVVLDRGRVIASGLPEVIRADAAVRAVYLGQAVP